MASPPPPKILLFGPGAIGTIYVHLLLKSGSPVTAVCRSNHSAAATSGFRIDSAHYGGTFHAHPHVARSCAEAASLPPSAGGPPYDYVIVSTKALPSSRTPSLIHDAITPGRTTIVLIQNGIGIEDEYAAAFPANPLLSCVVYLPATEVAPAHVVMAADERLEVGTFPAAGREGKGGREAEGLIARLRGAGGNATFFEHVQARRWYKLLLNAPWNPICALTLAKDVAILEAGGEDAEAVVRGVMEEVVELAGRLGHGGVVTREAAKSQLSRALDRRGSWGIEPSMLTDVLNGRAMEAEVILGNPVRIAREMGVAVPRMEMLYLLVKVLDVSARERKPGESLGR